MTLVILSFVAGLLTILAPCILPVIPFVFSTVDRPFLSNGLPTLAGLAASFAAVASLATVGGAWAADANDVARWVALAILAVLGAFLVFPRLAARWSTPLVLLGARVADIAEPRGSAAASLARSFLLGVATGMLWAPCAGPVLGLVLAGAAVRGPSAYTSLLLLAYGAGACCSLAAALWAGKRVFGWMKRALGPVGVARRLLGAAVIVSVVAIAFGVDTSVLARLSTDSSLNELEQTLLERLAPSSGRGAPSGRTRYTPDARPTARLVLAAADAAAPSSRLELPVQGTMPELSGATAWINSPALSAAALRGKVVLIDFWTFGCVNCLHALPYVRGWYERYKDEGFVVIGVHSPEFAYERRIGNVQRAVRDLGVVFPVAVDNSFVLWNSFANRYWPAHYFVDAQGRVRFQHVGEGDYERSEQVIRQLLEEAHASAPAAPGAASGR